jgi:hypothetical protein
MNYTIKVERGLTAYFKQPSGQSRPGVDWAVRIEGERSCTVIVRTYFSSNPPQETEKIALADKATLYVRKKLEQGWIPQQTILEVSDDEVI